MQDKDPVTLVILGASGDLTHRLLLPGLGTLLKSRPEYRVNLVGAAADDLTADQWADRVREGLAEGGCPAERVEQMVAATRFEHLDVTDPAALKAFLADLDAAGHPIVLYFARILSSCLRRLPNSLPNSDGLSRISLISN